MSEINKRIISSFLMLTILAFSYLNMFILTVVLIFIFFQIFYEFQYILKKIYQFKKKLTLYILLIIILAYLSILIILIWLIINTKSNDVLLLYLIITTCICTDIGGYTFGKIFKGKKLTKYSPNKTYSGLYGSYIFSFLTIYILFNNFFSLDKLFIFTFIISSVSQFGDIMISFLKRKAKIKDTSNIIPGHGGILDRLDGVIFALPFVFLLKTFL